MKITQLPSLVREALYLVFCLLFVWVCAPFEICLPFSPVPIVLQSNAIIFCAVLLGSRLATLNAALFVALGILGFPIWASGASGWSIFIGPTGGYLFGYIIGSLATGLIAEYRKPPTLARDFIAMLLGLVVIYAFGFAWLTQFVEPSAAFIKGVLPFIPGDCIKLVFFVLLLKRLPLGRFKAKENV
ncbi:MAG: biotin transporter BioY [Chlamydiia bacterium]|nr:biotin transporter BioY [Chlamydiia bacterium]